MVFLYWESKMVEYQWWTLMRTDICFMADFPNVISVINCKHVQTSQSFPEPKTGGPCSLPSRQNVILYKTGQETYLWWREDNKLYLNIHLSQWRYHFSRHIITASLHAILKPNILQLMAREQPIVPDLLLICTKLNDRFPYLFPILWHAPFKSTRPASC